MLNEKMRDYGNANCAFDSFLFSERSIKQLKYYFQTIARFPDAFALDFLNYSFQHFHPYSYLFHFFPGTTFSRLQSGK